MKFWRMSIISLILSSPEIVLIFFCSAWFYGNCIFHTRFPISWYIAGWFCPDYSHDFVGLISYYLLLFVFCPWTFHLNAFASILRIYLYLNLCSCGSISVNMAGEREWKRTKMKYISIGQPQSSLTKNERYSKSTIALEIEVRMIFPLYQQKGETSIFLFKRICNSRYIEDWKHISFSRWLLCGWPIDMQYCRVSRAASKKLSLFSLDPFETKHHHCQWLLKEV